MDGLKFAETIRKFSTPGLADHHYDDKIVHSSSPSFTFGSTKEKNKFFSNLLYEKVEETPGPALYPNSNEIYNKVIAKKRTFIFIWNSSKIRKYDIIIIKKIILFLFKNFFLVVNESATTPGPGNYSPTKINEPKELKFSF